MGRYSSVVDAINRRINAHRAAGQMLAGIKFSDTPVVDVEGQSDFPIIRHWLPELGERPNGGWAIIDGLMTLNLTVSTSRKVGLVAHIEKLELVMDALETPIDGEAAGEGELTVEGATAKPAVLAMKDPFVTDLSINSQITISVLPKPVSRGRRRI